MAPNRVDSGIDRSRIVDLLEIHRLKALYCYNLDNKQWPEWRALFTNDARLISGAEIVEGIDNILEYVTERLAASKSVHVGHMPLIEFESDVVAHGVWAMTGIIDYGDESVLYGFGHYKEGYRREGAAWKFTSVHLTHLRVDIIPVHRESKGPIDWSITSSASR